VTEVLDVKQDKVTGVKLKNLKTGAESVLSCAACSSPSATDEHGTFKGQIEMTPALHYSPKGAMTNVPGVLWRATARITFTGSHHGRGRGLRGGD